MLMCVRMACESGNGYSSQFSWPLDGGNSRRSPECRRSTAISIHKEISWTILNFKNSAMIPSTKWGGGLSILRDWAIGKVLDFTFDSLRKGNVDFAGYVNTGAEFGYWNGA